ncbi:MAG: alpha/beta hydrolase [Bacteroidota bacterium]
MMEIKRDGAVIRYTITGKGKTTLLFVHGSYMDQSCWNEQVAFFSSDYTVVTMDLPGHGHSGLERNHWSTQGFAEDVIVLINDLRLKNVILIGHSLAGAINLMAATQYPEPILGFIGIDTFKNAGMPLPAEYQNQTQTILQNLKISFENTNEQYARMALLTANTPAEIVEKVVDAYRDAYQPMGMEITPQVFNMYETERKLLPLLHFKLHLVNVEYIPTNETALKKWTTCGYQVYHMNGTCHYPMLENPGELNEILQTIISSVMRHGHQKNLSTTLQNLLLV